MHLPIKILMVLTSHASMGQPPQPTGVWFEELTTPYYAFVDAGAEVDLASIAGGRIPVDPHSLQGADQQLPSVQRFLHDPVAMAKLEGSITLEAVHEDGYAAVFLPGGHGTMWDLPASTRLADLLSKAWADGKVVAAVCHGPAGLLNARDVNGQPLLAGRRVAAFSNAEEVAAGLDKTVPFALETRIRALGADYQHGPAFQPFALRDGNLVSGQNPMSSAEVARLVLEAVRDAR